MNFTWRPNFHFISQNTSSFTIFPEKYKDIFTVVFITVLIIAKSIIGLHKIVVLSEHSFFHIFMCKTPYLSHKIFWLSIGQACICFFILFTQENKSTVFKETLLNWNFAQNWLIYPGVTLTYCHSDFVHHFKIAAICMTLIPQTLSIFLYFK